MDELGTGFMCACALNGTIQRLGRKIKVEWNKTEHFWILKEQKTLVYNLALAGNHKMIGNVSFLQLLSPL